MPAVPLLQDGLPLGWENLLKAPVSGFLDPSPPPKSTKDGDLQELMEMFICYDYKLVFFCWKVIYLKSDLQEIGLGVVREDVRGTFKGCLRKRFLTPSWSTFIQFV